MNWTNLFSFKNHVWMLFMLPFHVGFCQLPPYQLGGKLVNYDFFSAEAIQKEKIKKVSCSLLSISLTGNARMDTSKQFEVEFWQNGLKSNEYKYDAQNILSEKSSYVYPTDSSSIKTTHYLKNKFRYVGDKTEEKRVNGEVKSTRLYIFEPSRGYLLRQIDSIEKKGDSLLINTQYYFNTNDRDKKDSLICKFYYDSIGRLSLVEKFMPTTFLGQINALGYGDLESIRHTYNDTTYLFYGLSNTEIQAKEKELRKSLRTKVENFTRWDHIQEKPFEFYKKHENDNTPHYQIKYALPNLDWVFDGDRMHRVDYLNSKAIPQSIKIVDKDKIKIYLFNYEYY